MMTSKIKTKLTQLITEMELPEGRKQDLINSISEANNPMPIEWLRIDNDTNGNPRYVCHFLNFITDADRNEIRRQSIPDPTDAKYSLAIARAKKIGGRRFHNKQYGGGIVFQSYNIEKTEKDILELMKQYL